GALYVYRASVKTGSYLYFTVQNGTIANGYSKSYAGGIYGYGNAYTILTCRNVTFTNNTGNYAGAVYCSNTTTLDNCTFTGNTGTNTSTTASGSGAGAVYCASGKILTMTNCTITGHSGVRRGGVIIAGKGSTTYTSLAEGNNVIYGNTASLAGDDIYLYTNSGNAGEYYTVTLPEASVLAGGQVAEIYQDGTFATTAVATDSRYSDDNEVEVTGSVELCYSSSDAQPRAIGLEVVLTGDVVKYTVTYTDGSGEALFFADEVYSVKEGRATPVFAGTAERAHYTLTGWTPEVAETVTADVTYTAVWTENQYTVTLDANGGQLEEEAVTSFTITYGPAPPALPTPTRAGYELGGRVEAEGNGYTSGMVYELDADLTLTAKWSVYVVRYESTGESFLTVQAAFDAVKAAWDGAGSGKYV
ncbi:MAG: InlB B-repeat-containing protein, partial [Lachnospiraceae bacterium]|nr:InlB B-repeat-containing protein [Lachnospiraceae bacterium]